MVAGINEWRGRIEATPPPQNDYFTAVLPSGLSITRIRMTGPAADGGATFTGFMQVTGGSVFELSSTGTIDRIFSPPVTPGSLEVVFATGFNTTDKDWNVQIEVAGDVGCVPSPELCDDFVDNDCDSQVDCADSDCSADALCAPALYDQQSGSSGPSNIRSHSGFSTNEDAEAADDFTVPSGILNWVVDRVTARMPLAPTQNVRVVFRQDSGGTVGGAVPGCTFEAITSANYTVVNEQPFSKRIEAFLPSTCTLPAPGTYWVTIQGVGSAMPLFNWESSSAAFGANARFRSTANIGECTTGAWFDASACLNPPAQLISNPANAKSLHFAIHGTATPLAVCGDGVVDFGEDCDGGECCAPDCSFAPSGTPCGSGPTECSGQDTCSGAGLCEDNRFSDGTPCDDGDPCSTTDSCSAGLCAGGPDETDPTIDCSGIDPTRSTDAGVCSFTMPGTGFDPTFHDNCPGATRSNDFNGGGSLAGETFSDGSTSVIWTVTDASGASASCSVAIMIVDGEAPTITCPADIEGVEPTSPSGAVVSYTAPAASVATTDNCPGETVARTGGLGSGQVFPIGVTTETYTVTDGRGNTASCSFNVQVLSPTEVARSLIERVLQLVRDGVLTSGQGDGLLDKLNQIVSKIAAGNLVPACNQIRAFINQVNAFVHNGSLSRQQGDELIASAIHMGRALGCTGIPFAP